MKARRLARPGMACVPLGALMVAMTGGCHESDLRTNPTKEQTGVTATQGANAPSGSPSATTSLSAQSLPVPPPKFGGVIQPTPDQSKAWWPPQVRPPKGAPNVLLIMTDDVGFGAPSTFGGVIPTPTLDRIASAGLRYTAFHSTALCSPTRAALITGRNHHSVHTGVIVEQATGFPGYDTLIEKDTATIGQILEENGYATAWFGKDHNTPIWESTPAGPFDRWPSGLGFQYFYGFVGGDTSQWQPNLFRNHTAIAPYNGHPGWNLITAMADDAIQYMRGNNEIASDQPFFVYYVPGGTHAPHHPTPEWIAKFKGKFDAGWNALREQIFTNQKKLGVIPQNARLTAWPKDIPAWDSLSPQDKKLFSRQAEVYGAYLAYTDYEIGRVVQAVQDMGKLDNTLIIYISGDNGASPEGTLLGTFNEVASLNGVVVPVADQMKFYDAWGSDTTYPHYSVGWAWAFDTPFQWTKEVASHFGGTRQGMAMSWPGHIKDAGGIRNQFAHVIDVVPTILEACGIPQPQAVDGIAQRQMEGTSMAYTWDKANADAPTRHATQYFEMFGSRAIYSEGWIAAAPPIIPPWDLGKKSPPPEAYSWELYNLKDDWTENDNLAQKEPGRLKDLQNLFTSEATKYSVFPLDNDLLGRFVAPRPNPSGGRNVFTYTGELANVGWGGAPSLLDQSYVITADIEVPDGNAEGVLVTGGGRFGGYGFYLLKGRPVFTWNVLALAITRWEGPVAIGPGKHTLAFDFKYDGGGFGKGGKGVLRVDGKDVAAKRLEKTIPFLMQFDEAFNVGLDTGTAVEPEDYQLPFAFTGKLDKLTIELKGPPLSEELQRQKEKQEQTNDAAQ
jgi:arylsulfatase A-like enzyme